MISDLAWPVATVASWFIMYFMFIKPMLAKIHSTIGTNTTLTSATVPWWKKAWVYIEGSKTVIVSVLVSVFSMAKAAIDALSQNSNVVADAKDLPWGTFLTPNGALKVVGICMFLVTALHLWGVLSAAKATPKA